MTADELAKCKRAWETIREMENPARQSIAVALWTGLYAEELLQTAEAAITKASAALIAAAPDLYEALDACLRLGVIVAKARARAALAKARGEQS